MKPKEIAQEIVNINLMTLSNVYDSLRSKEYMAKQCALTCVKQMYNFESNGYSYEECNPLTQERLNDLDKIKEEIKKL